MEAASGLTSSVVYPSSTTSVTLRLENITEARLIGSDLNFMHLKEVEFINMPDLEKWVLGPNGRSFPMLERIKCKDCPNFFALPFLLECLAPYTQDRHYPRLRTLCIEGCPKLSLPPMPCTFTLTYVEVRDGPGYMVYKVNELYLRRYSGALAFHNMGKLEGITIREGLNIPWTELQKLTSLRSLEISEESSMQSMALLSIFTALTSLELVNCENLRVDGFNPLITTVNLKKLVVYNCQDRPRSVAADLLSEVAIWVQSSAAGSSFQLEWLEVDSISAVLVAPICSLLGPTLWRLSFRNDERVESLTEEEEKALQLLTSLHTLCFFDCPGLPSLPQGLHSFPSLNTVWAWDCPEIRSLPNGGLPTSVKDLVVRGCSAELREQAKKLQRTNPDLSVDA